MPVTAAVEAGLPLESLLRLKSLGPAAALDLIRLAERGDWRTRALALSALGQIVRSDPYARRFHFVRHKLARALPALKRRFASVGPRGAYVRPALEQGLDDPAWIVRVAAALALAECREPAAAPALGARLADGQRPVRIAAGAGLAALGRPPAGDGPSLLAEADSAPERIGDTDPSRDWLRQLALAHAPILEAWRRLPTLPQPAGDSPEAWAVFLAGEVRLQPRDSREAEILRYAQGKETHYNFTKPFSHVNRSQNIRMLHAFLTVAENLRVPLQGRVLDLGGGAAWVSELLAKLGYRPVTLDLSTALLGVGRDRFTREHLPFRGVAADMSVLPFRSESLDAVVVIDALHHVPDVPAVFREAHRVLVTGGQFVFAEAGEGHAETQKSRAELSEHGVCEREIHLFDAVRHGRDAGFGDVRVIPHFEPSLYFRPEDVAAAMGAPSERWTVYEERERASFDHYIMRSMLGHPVMAFAKGERPIDSRMPRELRAELRPRLAREQARLSGRVSVANRGDTRWLRGGDEPGRVRLGLQLMTPERSLLDLNFSRCELPADVAPGVSVDVAVELVLPDPTARYVLKLDMVDEHVCWFEDVGSRPVYVSV